ncbi:PREDICTED: syntaxin-18 [Nicrophorus vespilloides]|uniref:Syntaxin-18 n=1 Tax=Nicrophorus vespilloides TaxID=110193 RepID=A0ABM1MSH5_NICVS|nr:PREDICTED: syntaxin-18 [Nicrophorus vespilloides]
MDVTILFKACVKTVRTTNKSLGLKDAKSDILRSSKDGHLRKAKEIVRQITNLQKFFTDNKVAYLNVVNYLSTNKTMTEQDRIEIDAEAQKIINLSTAMIGEYRKEIVQWKLSKQQLEHYENILNTIEAYLKEVSKVYIEAKAMRVKKVIEMHKISKLEMPSSSSTATEQTPRIPSQSETQVENELSAEEMQMFESENDMLYNELNSISDEVKQIESKVVHIAELQELFTEKVLQQEMDIDRIANVVAATTDDMKGANEQIRQAIQRNAGLRVWVLFFLLIMSFSLLFLDWYND